MTHGQEPTALIYKLLNSQLDTLIRRGLAVVSVGKKDEKPIVVIVLANAIWSAEDGVIEA